MVGRGRLWAAQGARSGGAEAEWSQGLAGAEPPIELHAGEVPGGVLDALKILGMPLRRRAVARAVTKWRTAADAEVPFVWNPGFFGREKELVQIRRCNFCKRRHPPAVTGPESQHPPS